MRLVSRLALSIILTLSTIYASEEVPTQEEVSKLYVSTFNRAPDSSGLDYWLNNSKLKLSEIALSFSYQPETQNLYPDSITDKEFINLRYQFLFNRDADNAGMLYWLAELNNGRINKDRFILAMINGALD
ncbi:MAG: hypothetical protein COB17_09105, partial [Sulfurimonas sp.]